MTQERLIELLQSEGVYEVIASHYWELSKEQVKEISLEMFWQLEKSKGDYDKANTETIKQLKENWEL